MKPEPAPTPTPSISTSTSASSVSLPIISTGNGNNIVHCPHCSASFSSSRSHHLHSVHYHGVRDKKNKKVKPQTELFSLSLLFISCPICPSSFTSSKQHHLHNLYHHRGNKESEKVENKYYKTTHNGAMGKSNIATTKTGIKLRATATTTSKIDNAATAVAVRSTTRVKNDFQRNFKTSSASESKTTCEYCGIRIDDDRMLISHLIETHESSLEQVDLSTIDVEVLRKMPIKLIF